LPLAATYYANELRFLAPLIPSTSSLPIALGSARAARLWRIRIFLWRCAVLSRGAFSVAGRRTIEVRG